MILATTVASSLPFFYRIIFYSITSETLQKEICCWSASSMKNNSFIHCIFNRFIQYTGSKASHDRSLYNHQTQFILISQSSVIIITKCQNFNQTQSPTSDWLHCSPPLQKHFENGYIWRSPGSKHKYAL